jgi:hypothetical protein
MFSVSLGVYPSPKTNVRKGKSERQNLRSTQGQKEKKRKGPRKAKTSELANFVWGGRDGQLILSRWAWPKPFFSVWNGKWGRFKPRVMYATSGLFFLTVVISGLFVEWHRFGIWRPIRGFLSSLLW